MEIDGGSMSRLTKLAVALALAATVPVAAQRGPGQPPAPPSPYAAPAGEVLGVGTFIHAVTDVNNSAAFYAEFLGAMVNGAAGPRQFAPNPVVASLYGVPGSDFRGGTIRIPGTEIGGAELVDWGSVPSRRAVRPKIQDPGAAVLLLSVRDIEPLVETVKKFNGAVVTPGGTPKAFAGALIKGRVVMVTDPDGFLIQLVQLDTPPESTAPAGSNVLAAGLAFTVKNADTTMRYYQDVLGFAPGLPRELNATGAGTLVPEGIAPVVAKVMVTRVPGTGVPVAFVEMQGGDANANQSTIRDPGAGMLRLRVKDIDALLPKLKAGGATVSSENGQPVTFANGQRMVVIHDPNNFFIQPVQAAPPQPRQP
jgi:predicted enzyme related to lactoylglutathione lyase